MKNDLNDVVTSFQLSRETMSKIKQNMFFALFYNIIGIPIAARVFIGLGLVLKPELAGLAMAMSSISVVGNSLLLRYFKPNKRNYLSLVAPIVMVIIFTFGFIQFAKLSSDMENQEMNSIVSVKKATTINNFIASSEAKINFDNGDPDIFIGADILPSVLKAKEGTLILNNDELVIGYSDGMSMKKENVISGVNSILTDIPGLTSVKVAGIIEPTGTVLDNYHYVNVATLVKMPSVAVLKFVAENEIIKSFYFVTPNNIPQKFTNDIKGFEPVILAGKKYLPIYIGSAEAKMMISTKLISQVGDTIDNLFGNNVIIAGILPPTDTPLDMMHFVGPEFQLR